jgi:hypothetical protein
MEKQTLLTLHRSVFSSLFFASTLLLLCIFSCQTAEEKSKKPIMQFSQFANEAPLEITITTNLEALFEKKDDPMENEKEIFQKANCKILKNGETFFKGKIKIKKRGVTRKKICAIPPVMIKFGKNKKSFKIKLVTPCLKNKDAQQLVYKEYLTYQIYRNLTPHSFKTQLVNITYKDKKDRMLDIEATGFLIEEVNEAAERMTAKLLQRHDKIRYLNQDSYRLFAMFQYCIGNTDWNLKLHHNIRMIQKTDSASPIPVPYDFDYAGLVDAPYAVPHSRLPINNVRERYFMWREKDYDGFERFEGFEEVIKLFEEKKLGVLEKIENFEQLEDGEKEEMLNYIESFYEKIAAVDSFQDDDDEPVLKNKSTRPTTILNEM